MLKDKLLWLLEDKSKAADAAFAALRVFVGLTMALAHGFGKLPPSDRFVAAVEALGFPLPTLFAWCAALSEFAAALFLAVGLLTRPAAVAVGLIMFVAAFFQHASDPFRVKELAFLYLALSATFVAAGGGRWSADAWLRKRLSGDT